MAKIFVVRKDIERTVKETVIETVTLTLSREEAADLSECLDCHGYDFVTLEAVQCALDKALDLNE